MNQWHYFVLSHQGQDVGVLSMNLERHLVDLPIVEGVLREVSPEEYRAVLQTLPPTDQRITIDGNVDTPETIERKMQNAMAALEAWRKVFGGEP